MFGWRRDADLARLPHGVPGDVRAGEPAGLRAGGGGRLERPHGAAAGRGGQ